MIIDHTEALVSIDVNTGRFTGKKSQEETILKTNLEAAEEIGRQLRLRDLGGIIVIDFIDMEQETSKKQVLDTLRSALRQDRSRTKVFAISDLGLIEMTRQRERPSLVHYYSEDCPSCGGSGKVLSVNTAAMKVDRFLRVGAHSKEKLVQRRLHPDVATYLFDSRSESLERLEKELKTRVDVREDPRMRRDDIRIVFPRTQKDVTAEFLRWFRFCRTPAPRQERRPQDPGSRGRRRNSGSRFREARLGSVPSKRWGRPTGRGP